MLTLTLSISLLCFPNDKTVIEDTNVTEAKSVYLNMTVNIEGSPFPTTNANMIYNTSNTTSLNGKRITYYGAGFSLTASVGSNEKEWNWGSLSVGSSNKTTSTSKTLSNCPFTLNNTKCKVVYSVSNSTYYSVSVTINGSSISSGSFLNSGQNGNTSSTFNIVATITPKTSTVKLTDNIQNTTLNTYYITYGKLYDMDTIQRDYEKYSIMNTTQSTKYRGKHISYWQLAGTTVANTEYPSQIIINTLKGDLKAFWVNNTYTVKFDANGGKGSMSNQSFTCNISKALSKNTFQWTGYEFLGWSTDPYATAAQYTDGASVSNLTTSDGNTVTLYAVWEKVPYKVDINILSPSGSQDYNSGTMSQTYNGTKKTGLTDQYYSNLYINETFTISDIVPATGYVLSTVTCTNGKITNNGNGSYTFTANFSSNPSGDWDAVIEIKMSLGTYTLTVDPGGGTWNGSTATQTFSQNYLTTKSIAVPTREGYDFAGWVIDGSFGTLSSVGKVNSKYGDQFFKTGNNGTGVYNNSSNGTVTHTYLSTPYDDVSLTSGARILKIRNTGSASPGLGGFTNYLQSYASAVFYTVIYAKIPTGYTLGLAANAYGDNKSNKWLTSNAGTGEWETYILRWNCGSSGSFSSINFFYLNGTTGTSTNPVDWYVGYFGTYDATGLSASENLATTTTFTYGAGDVRIVALWTKKDLTITINTDGGKYNGNSSATISANTRDLVGLETPTKEGYVFKGWQITSGSAVLSPVMNVYTGETFNGTDYITIGRDGMYEDKITISLWASMNNWSDYSSKSMRLISCTESGGWNFEANGGNIQCAIYEKGKGYNSITTDKAWSSLSSGWHHFAITFDGTKAYLYIDGVMVKSSSTYASGKIGYNSSNGIFIGAEAGSNSTSPAGGYFTGEIKDVVIINEFSYGMSVTQNDSAFISLGTNNITVKALWEETWINKKSDNLFQTDETENWYNINNANDLARIAYLFNYTDRTDIDTMKFKLTANIDLSDYWWEPIGTETRPFRATFDGNGYSIYGLSTYVNEEYTTLTNYNGLFGHTAGATITNVALDTVDIHGNKYTGGLVGKATEATYIENCYVSGNIVGMSRYTGGLVGYAVNNVVINLSVSTAELTGMSCTGGIAGGYSDGGSITTCYSTSNININWNSLNETGTLVGGASTTMFISDCFYVGSSNKSIGNFYGSAYTPKSINSCYTIINSKKVKSVGEFTNWTIYTYLNEGRPIQVALLHIAKGDAKPDEVLNYFTKNSFTQT